MLRFTSELRLVSTRVEGDQKRTMRRAQKGKREKNSRPRTWPAPVQALWTQMIDELDEGLAVADDELVPRRVLLQAHVTTEAEREDADRRFGPCPPNLAWRIKDLHLTIHRLLRRNAELLGRMETPRGPIRGAPRLEWPMSPLIYTSYFGLRRDPITGVRKFHTGVDLGASKGVLINAAGPGRVVFAGWNGGYGRCVVVQHIGGYQTLYAHMSNILVMHGVQVDSGTPLGQVGSTGRSTGPHLHFEVRRGGRPMDPMKAVGLRVARSPSTNRRASR